MPQSLTQIYLHVVFSTKNRMDFLADENVRAEMHAYLAASCKKLDCPAVKVGGIFDHVHVLCRVSKSMTCSQLVKEIKRPSSAWIKGKTGKLATFAWQAGYGAFSVSQSSVDGVTRYIEQQAHHRNMSFKEEFVRLLKQHHIEYDPRYLWG